VKIARHFSGGSAGSRHASPVGTADFSPTSEPFVFECELWVLSRVAAAVHSPPRKRWVCVARVIESRRHDTLALRGTASAVPYSDISLGFSFEVTKKSYALARFSLTTFSNWDILLVY